MEIKNGDKPSKFEQLFVELINKGYDVSLDNEQTDIRLWLNDWSLILRSDGKWLIE
jgi:hypothetical protein